MIASVGRLILSLLLAGAPASSLAVEVGPTDAGLASRIFQYLDASDGDAAERLLQGVLSDESASINTVSQLIRTSRIYQNQPVGDLPHEQIVIRGQTYPLSLLIPPTYQTTKSYALVVCLHGFGFTGEEYLERWRTRLGEEYLLACPTYPSGAWFTRRAEELVLATIRELQARYHVDPNRI
ncbi:MAG: hypothetical protein HP495_04025, partial [Nitrospira sp.]|nr:hypothetical protein [Nitrospira sp.]